MDDLKNIRIRTWLREDKDALVRYANNRNIWLNMRDLFPHPYTDEDAGRWLERCAAQGNKPTHFAIVSGEEAIGSVGFDLMEGEFRITGEIGYWIAEPFWGKGIATFALRQATEKAFESFPVERLEAAVFSWNPASERVLEKAGYHMEARLKRSIIKDGRIGDALIYARLRDSLPY